MAQTPKRLPPFQLSAKILKLAEQVSKEIGKIEGLEGPRPQPHLRKQNRVSTIQGTVAIEGNSLGLDAVTAVLDGKRVVAPARELKEVQNAISTYEMVASLSPLSQRDFLKAHDRMLKGLSTLQELSDTLRPEPETPADRLERALAHFKSRDFSRRDYLSLFRNISPPTASRDLATGIASGILRKSGEKALTRYRKD